MIYVRNNAAKQWILQDLDLRFGQGSVRILDLGCGTGLVWKDFLVTHPNMHVVGIDIDQAALDQGKAAYGPSTQIELRTFDAQKPFEQKDFDVVVALSALEHVVDHPAFLKTVWSSLKNGGVAYLNYDVGHFRSRDVKERLMVPVSQLLAKIGMEGPYMKQVDDQHFRTAVEAQGFVVKATMKHNLVTLKGFMRDANDDAIEAWYAFEAKLRDLFPPERLDKILWSTTVVAEKP